MPLLNYRGIAPIEVSVILDSDCWKKSLTYCSRKLEELCKLSKIAISFSCENSSRVPGLQIADFFAGITKDYYNDVDVSESYDLSTKHRITRLGN